MLNLFHPVEGPCIVAAHRQSSLGVDRCSLQDAGVLGGGDPGQAGKRRVECQEAARLQMLAATNEGLELRIGGEVVDEGVKRNHDERVAAADSERGHVRLVQLW